MGDADKGEITIGCSPSVAARFMPSLMLEFARCHPQITLKFEEGDQEKLIRDLVQGRIELAVAFDHGLPSGFEAEFLLTLPPVVSLPSTHRLAGAKAVSLEELEDEPLILYDASYSRDYTLGLFDALDLQPNIALRLRSFELIRGLVGRGHGYSINTVVPVMATTYDGSRIVTKPLSDPVPKARVVCITPGSHLTRPAVSIFAGFLKTNLGATGEDDEEPVLMSYSAA